MNALPPKPVPDRDTQPFWDAVSQRRLVVQRCAACGRWIWQPRPICPACHAANAPWTEVTGAGTVASWTVLHPPVLPVWGERVPFVVLLVHLDEGVRMVGQMVDAAGEPVRSDDGVGFGARVALAWRMDEGGNTLPAWTLAGA